VLQSQCHPFTFLQRSWRFDHQAQVQDPRDAAQQAHAINEGRLQNFELCRGFARRQKLAAGLPH